jgi:hypothetical protein
MQEKITILYLRILTKTYTKENLQKKAEPRKGFSSFIYVSKEKIYLFRLF